MQIDFLKITLYVVGMKTILGLVLKKKHNVTDCR